MNKKILIFAILGMFLISFASAIEYNTHKLNEDFDLGIRASDSWLLGHLRKEDVGKLSRSQLELIKDYKRGEGYRFCLTKLFEERERQEGSEI